jgi:hypothetical protein
MNFLRKKSIKKKVAQMTFKKPTCRNKPNLYNENHKTVKTEIEKNTRRRKGLLWSWISRIIV